MDRGNASLQVAGSWGLEGTATYIGPGTLLWTETPPYATARRWEPASTQAKQDGRSLSLHDAARYFITPGLVNAHTHLDLGEGPAIPPPEAGDMVDWLLAVVKSRGQATESVSVADSLNQACQRFKARGTGAVLDVTQHPKQVLEAMATHGLSGILAHEWFYPGAYTFPSNTLLSDAKTPPWRLPSYVEEEAKTLATLGSIRLGTSPHSPYNVSLSAWQACLQEAPAYVHTHFAECQLEAEYFHEGPKSARIKALHQALLGRTFAPEGDWHAYLEAWPADQPGVLVHACELPEPALLAFLEVHPHVYVVTCPRSNLFLHGKTLSTQAITALEPRLLLGTDSLLSCPDDDILQEWQGFQAFHRPNWSPERAMAMLTLRGFEAMALPVVLRPWVVWQLPETLINTGFTPSEALACILAGGAEVYQWVYP
jgi:cytosine/adenosine deaminase-related metal-dependent hydrolase